jgi:CRISPR-associated endonuclease/helicase Cas3
MKADTSQVTFAIAHIARDGQAQPLLEHLTAVSALCSRLAAKIGLARAGALIGLLHDLGKYSSEFQEYLHSFQPGSDVEPQEELRGKIDHSTAGAQQVLRQLTNAVPVEPSLPSPENCWLCASHRTIPG